MYQFRTDALSIAMIVGGAALAGGSTLLLANHGSASAEATDCSHTVAHAKVDPRVVVSVGSGENAFVVSPNVTVDTEDCASVVRVTDVTVQRPAIHIRETIDRSAVERRVREQEARVRQQERQVRVQERHVRDEERMRRAEERERRAVERERRAEERSQRAIERARRAAERAAQRASERGRRVEVVHLRELQERLERGEVARVRVRGGDDMDFDFDFDFDHDFDFDFDFDDMNVDFEFDGERMVLDLDGLTVDLEGLEAEMEALGRELELQFGDVEHELEMNFDDLERELEGLGRELEADMEQLGRDIERQYGDAEWEELDDDQRREIERRVEEAMRELKDRLSRMGDRPGGGF